MRLWSLIPLEAPSFAHMGPFALLRLLLPLFGVAFFAFEALSSHEGGMTFSSPDSQGAMGLQAMVEVPTGGAYALVPLEGVSIEDEWTCHWPWGDTLGMVNAVDPASPHFVWCGP